MLLVERWDAVGALMMLVVMVGRERESQTRVVKGKAQSAPGELFAALSSP